MNSTFAHELARQRHDELVTAAGLDRAARLAQRASADGGPKQRLRHRVAAPLRRLASW